MATNGEDKAQRVKCLKSLKLFFFFKSKTQTDDTEHIQLCFGFKCVFVSYLLLKINISFCFWNVCRLLELKSTVCVQLTLKVMNSSKNIQFDFYLLGLTEFRPKNQETFEFSLELKSV